MSVIVQFSIPAEDFSLGRGIQQATDVSVELEKMIPSGDSAIPYFWVIGENQSTFDAILDQEPEISTYAVVDELNGRRLYRAEWDHTVDSFVQAIADHDVVLQEANGGSETWTFQLRFSDSHRLSEFHTDCKDKGIELSVEGLYNPIEPAGLDMGDLTEAQRSLITRVYQEGYFDVPRKTTLAEIAEELDISDQAVNERLRRGLSTLIGATLDENE